MYGAAYCHWTEMRRETSGSGVKRRNVNKRVHFEGKEVYLNSQTYLFGAEGADHFDVQGGIHRYEFSCQLPPSLPGSFKASYGHTSYSVEALLDSPFTFEGEFKLQFTVLRNDDLNLEPQLKLPCTCEEIKQFRCLFCQSDPLMMTVTLPFSGFAPGQLIPITVIYHNKSDVAVSKTKICLQRVIRFNR